LAHSQGDGPAAPGGDLVDVVDHHHLVAGRCDEYHWIAVVHRRQGAVLELTAKDALAVGVGDLLELQGSLQGDGMG
jgi:hypothetical protein